MNRIVTSISVLAIAVFLVPDCLKSKIISPEKKLILLKKAIKGKDIEYANLAGDFEAMAKNIVKAMHETVVVVPSG